jgi:hypothetical protein
VLVVNRVYREIQKLSDCCSYSLTEEAVYLPKIANFSCSKCKKSYEFTRDMLDWIQVDWNELGPFLRIWSSTCSDPLTAVLLADAVENFVRTCILLRTVGNSSGELSEQFSM